jgi:hypothetical protein
MTDLLVILGAVAVGSVVGSVLGLLLVKFILIPILEVLW